MKVINIIISEKDRMITLINDKQAFETEYEKAISDSLELAYKNWHKQLKEFIKQKNKESK